jgi:2-C-methyl-D-erythritol 4-phosphate cytidylyltransferase
VQTPQAFHASILREAHLAAEHEKREGTDDASLVEAIGGYVVVVPGDVMNRKITTPEDFAWAENVIANMQRGNS